MENNDLELKTLLTQLNKNALELNRNILLLKSSSDEAGPKAATEGKDAVNLAIIGALGRGKRHIAGFTKLKDCNITHVCDVDTRVAKAAAREIASQKHKRPRITQDYREVLKDPDVDAVAIATPNHWHAVMAIHALQAGKHVYIERPVTHSYAEGDALLAAAKKYSNLVVQSGTQLRSNTSLKTAGKFMRSGGIGEVYLVHCICHKDRPPVPLSDTSALPESIDYNLWCGPAHLETVKRSKFHWHWHWLWRFGNGALGSNGIHRIDAARIALDLKGFGDFVISAGDRYGVRDGGETPNNMLTLHRFGNTWVLQDILGLNPKPFRGLENAVIFYGTEGTIVYKAGHAALVDENFEEVRKFEGRQLNHYYNFLRAIREKNRKLARGSLREGIISSDLCHFGNISYRIGKDSTFEEVQSTFERLDAPAIVLERLDALRSNLVENGIEPTIKLGRLLELRDDRANPIVNDNGQAAMMLSTPYRSEFELPSADKV